ncbi:MAG: hypothetical protein IJ224_04640 [Lachnospiraceae bacterium]|nr:hypothetical protein [Lachnospiraceae bacterium]
MNMTFGDIVWDVAIALSNIIFINVAFYNRTKGFRAFCLYFLMCCAYVFMDYILFVNKKFGDHLSIYIIGVFVEFSILYMCSCMAEGNVWRNFTFICTMQVIVSALIGLSSFFDADIKFILYNDAMYRKKTSDFSGYIKISIVQVFFAYIVGKLFCSIIRKISKKDHIFYKFFFLFYCIYAVVISNFKYNMTFHDLELPLIIYVIIQCIATILFSYFLFLLYNRSLRKKIENELIALEAENTNILKKYDEIIAENQSLNNVKTSFNTYIKDISNNTKNNEKLKKYVSELIVENKDISGNPLTGSLMIDSMISDMENKLKDKGVACELTIGKSCEEHIMKNENKIAYIIKSIIDLKDFISDNSYVVIGIRNKAHMLFISVNMQCDIDINKKRPLISLANYIRLDRGCCVYKKTDNNAVIDILILVEKFTNEKYIYRFNLTDCIDVNSDFDNKL